MPCTSKPRPNFTENLTMYRNRSTIHLTLSYVYDWM